MINNSWPSFLSSYYCVVFWSDPAFEMSSDEVEMWWDAGRELLRSRVSYCFAKKRSHLWGVGTWSKHVQPSEIKKHGTDEDKLVLEAQPVKARSWTQKQRAAHTRKKREKTNNNEFARALESSF